MTLEGLPTGWTARRPDERDISRLADLRASVTRAATGSASPDVARVLSEVTESGSWVRRHVVVFDADGTLRGWGSVHDRAAGRSMIEVLVDPELDDATADVLAARLFEFGRREAEWFVSTRDREGTQLDSGAYEGDARQARWLGAAGYTRVRRWLQMTRPVTAEDAGSPALREGVQVRRVRRRPNGLPVAEDLQAVHHVLESSFEDHFNAYRESFSEFVNRLRSDTGHAWDHWWLATVIDESGVEVPGGAIVSSMSAPDGTGTYGTYIDYIGVDAAARGRGLAKGLLNTVIADAAARGRNRVGLEVDATSPTGADGLYTSMGWTTSYVTESWHQEIDLAQ